MLSETGYTTSCVDDLLVKLLAAQPLGGGQLDELLPVSCTCTAAVSKSKPLMVSVNGRYCSGGDGLVEMLVTLGVVSCEKTIPRLLDGSAGEGASAHPPDITSAPSKRAV